MRRWGAWLVVVAACSRGGAAANEPPPDAIVVPSGIDARPLVEGAGLRAFGGACVEDAECAGGVCFHKRVHEPGRDAGHERRGENGPVERDGYCSMRCNDDVDCPVPLTRGRCGARGMCKRPE